LHGVVATHLLQQAPAFRDIHDGHRKSGSDDARAHWVLLVETTRNDYAGTAGKLLRYWLDARVLGLSEGEVGIYDLMYAV